MTAGRVHIVGAGVAGLSAATALAAQGHSIALYDSSPQAGGRCRSYVDQELGCRIDNGNHLMLSGNKAIAAYLDRIGARASLIAKAPVFSFVDLENHKRWSLRLNKGRLPLWILNPWGRVPGSHAWQYIRDLLALQKSAEEDGTTQFLRHTRPLGRPLWEPLSVSILNTELEAGSSALLWQVFQESLAAGGAACQPLLPRQGLSEALVDPALAYLRQKPDCRIRFNTRLRAIAFEGERATALDFGAEKISLGSGDQLILAAPASVAAELVPGLVAPDQFRPIVNAHFAYDLPARYHEFIGVVGGLAEWVFIKPGILSVTISAADHAVDTGADELIAGLWEEVCAALALGVQPLPAARIVKEKRATFAATPAQDKRRPEARTAWSNLVLAGDWTRTGLPATIEGAVRSGQKAADLVRGLTAAAARTDSAKTSAP